MTTRQQAAHASVTTASLALNTAILEAEASGLKIQVVSGRTTYSRMKDPNPVTLFIKERS